MSVLQVAIVCLLAFIAAIAMHEIGHLRELKTHFKKVSLTWDGKDLLVGTERMYRALHPLDAGAVYLWGILWGFLPLTLLVFIDRWGFLTTAAVYLYGCKHDMKQLWNIRRGGL